ncbi:MAG: Lipid biosynthesis lauroyl acyltransferase [Pseudomonadota bacterium]|jgi:KDO2-lipid IV(A) lauroyltransferase
MARLLIVFMRFLAWWPLPLLRGLGAVLGVVLYALARERRHVADVNLALCFPQWSHAQRRQVVRRHFVCVMQSLLDRAWLWHAPVRVLQKRLQVTGDVSSLEQEGGVVVFAPHFVGLDAGGVALTLVQDVPMASIYVPQRGQALDDWVRHGRNRNGRNRLYERHAGVKPLVAGLRQGEKLYLLPDMDFGAAESVFVPFFGVQAATLPSLSRFARLGRAQVLTVVSRMTPWGYRVEVGEPWEGFPSDDVMADTRRMNQALEDQVQTMPEQYYWVHKRFKTRPPGSDPVY